MNPQNRARVTEHDFASGSKDRPPGTDLEYRLVDLLLQAPDLQRDRRLRAAQPARRLGDAAGIYHRDEGAQRPDVLMSDGHGDKLRLCSAYRLAISVPEQHGLTLKPWRSPTRRN